MARSSSSGNLSVLRELNALRNRLLKEIGKIIVGQEETLDLLFSSLLAGGHSLLIGVPGLAKTLMISSLARILDVSFNRVQFTPDLMPSDITGSDVIEEVGRSKKFRFIKGPVFANVVLADEINRTPPKTQAALLQAMQEQQVTVSGNTYSLDAPFFVLATQNPIEQEGTYPLPEAQLDRFMYSVRIPYPELEEELRIVSRSAGVGMDADLKAVCKQRDLLRFQSFIKNSFPIADSITEATVRLIRQTRPDTSSKEIVKKYVAWGAGPRAGTFLVLGAKAMAAMAGKKAVDLDDVRRVAYPVLWHRVLTNYEAEADGVTPDHIIGELLADLRL